MTIINRIIWTDEEIQILKENYEYASQEKLFELLPRIDNMQKIRAKASQFGIKRKVVTPRKRVGKIRRWSPSEVAILETVFPITANVDLENKFDREIKEILRKAKSLGLEKKLETIQRDKVNQMGAMTRGTIWTNEEEDILKKYYPTKGVTGVKKLLPHRSRNSIRSKVIKLGITKTSSASWRQTDISIDRKDIYSITVQYERIDR